MVITETPLSQSGLSFQDFVTITKLSTKLQRQVQTQKRTKYAEDKSTELIMVSTKGAYNTTEKGCSIIVLHAVPQHLRPNSLCVKVLVYNVAPRLRR